MASFLVGALGDHRLDSVSSPATETIVHRLPGPVPFRQVPPGRAGARHPKNGVEDGSMVFPRAAAALLEFVFSGVMDGAED